jgi:tetratricopeptide (TPR) repeat protein
MSDEIESGKEPNTPDELLATYKILRSDPQRFLRVVNERIKKSPDNLYAYFDRHYAWMHLGEPRRALEDLNTAIGLEPEPDALSLFARGLVHRRLGEYEKALEDFNNAEAINPKGWDEDIVFGLLYQADTHARLGHEAEALACCTRLPDDFWTPGVYGAPGGDKAEVADALRGIAAEARQNRPTS